MNYTKIGKELLKENEIDFYFNNMNEKSYKDYKKYIESR